MIFSVHIINSLIMKLTKKNDYKKNINDFIGYYANDVYCIMFKR